MKRLFSTRGGDQVQLGANPGPDGLELRVIRDDDNDTTTDTATARVRRCADGTLLVEQDGIVRPARVSTVGERAWLWTPATSTAVDRVQPRRRGEGGDSGSTISAPMTGRIVVVDVAVGDEVTRGQQVLVIEAMKMEQPLKAPRDGVVVKVDCEPGQLVDGGTVLVTLAAQEAP